MADIVNLRQARKRKLRAEKEAKAAENRVAFGRSKAETSVTRGQREIDLRRLEGHRRDASESGDE